MPFIISEELKKLPARPGVYIMHNAHDEIIYVGKAVVLKNRVRQYFQSNKNHTEKIRQMVSQVAWFEYIVVDSELEALVLECNLIKEHQPKYNTMLKDSKGYPYIKVTVNEMYPRVEIARERRKDNAEYFGPFTSEFTAHNAVDLIHKACGIRRCTQKLYGKPVNARPCLYYSLGQCKGPCMGNVPTDEYRKNVEDARDFLSGRYNTITKQLEDKMQRYSDNLEFEKAAETRDILKSFKMLSEAQKADECDDNDRDIVALCKNDSAAVVSGFFIRQGKMLGRDHFYMTGVKDETEPEILQNFLKQFYSGTPHIPKEIYISEEIGEADIIAGWLSEIKGRKVTIFTPKKGEKKKLIEMAQNNARTVLFNDENRMKEQMKKTTGALLEIQELLHLPVLHRVESYDISNTQGFENVASMVVFEDGKPKKTDYRRFKTRTVLGADDYKSMKEVLKRRFEHGLREMAREDFRTDSNDSFVRFPDLLLIDGGRGQVNSVLEVMHELSLDIPVCGMVKDDHHRTRGLFFNDEEVPIDIYSEGFKLVTRIQDETHRFAIEYHKSLRGKAQTHSILDDINGIGEKRRIALMSYYDSIDSLKKATVEELADLPAMNRKSAETVYEFFHKKEGN